MLVVESWVAEGDIVFGEVVFGDAGGASEAFGDIFSGEFEVDSAEDGACGFVGLDGVFEFGEDVVEVSCFDSGSGCCAVGVHGVGHPEDMTAFAFDAVEQRREAACDFGCAHADDEDEFAWFVGGVEGVDEGDEFVWVHGWTDFDSDRVVDSFEELDVWAVEVAVAFTDPGEVGGEVEMAFTARHGSGLGLFVVEVESFV